jgi:hypothetical protein
VPRQPRLTEVDAVAAQGNPLSVEQSTLPLPHREAPVGADDAVPRQILVRVRQHVADQARRVGVDVAVRPDESLRNVPHTGNDSPDARVLTRAAHRSAT